MRWCTDRRCQRLRRCAVARSRVPQGGPRNGRAQDRPASSATFRARARYVVFDRRASLPSLGHAARACRTARRCRNNANRIRRCLQCRDRSPSLFPRRAVPASRGYARQPARRIACGAAAADAGWRAASGAAVRAGRSRETGRPARRIPGARRDWLAAFPGWSPAMPGDPAELPQRPPSVRLRRPDPRRRVFVAGNAPATAGCL